MCVCGHVPHSPSYITPIHHLRWVSRMGWEGVCPWWWWWWGGGGVAGGGGGGGRAYRGRILMPVTMGFCSPLLPLTNLLRDGLQLQQARLLSSRLPLKKAKKLPALPPPWAACEWPRRWPRRCRCPRGWATACTPVPGLGPLSTPRLTIPRSGCATMRGGCVDTSTQHASRSGCATM